MAQSKKIVGMENGKADTVIAADTIHGGAGNRDVHSHDARTLTSKELLEKIRLRECSAGTVKIFADERVTGSEFMDDLDDKFLNDLNITDKTDIRKLKSLQKALSKGD